MRISFACGSCATVLEADAQSTGHTVACPRCGTALKVPTVRPGPGVTIGGFRIKKLIARGGMGEVYLAEQLSLGRDVALKILPQHFKSDPETVQRFLAEVRTAAKLSHPNLVTVYEAGQDNGIYFLAMGYIDGETLDERLEKKGALSEAQALEITYELAGALSAAWQSHRLIHCDVKPGNIMVDRNGKPHLMDMGLSKLLTESATTATAAEAFGTPNYVSPEQSMNEPHLDFRSDMFSLGMTLYHMLTGRLPFDAPTPAETLHKLDTETLLDPRSIVTGISPSCVVLLERMLGRKPLSRYPDWAVFLKDCSRVRKGGKPAQAAMPPGESVLGRTTGPATGVLPLKRGPQPSTPMKPEPRKHSWVGLVVTLLMVAAVGLGGYMFRDQLMKLIEGPKPPPAEMTPDTNAPSETDLKTPPSRVTNERDTALQKQFLAAQRYEKEHPLDFLTIIKQYKEIQEDGGATVWADRAAIEIQRWEATRQLALDEVYKHLQSQVDRLVADGKLVEAIALLRNYNGRFQYATKVERTAQADKLQEQLDREGVLEKVKLFLAGVADELLRMDFVELKRKLTAAEMDAVLSASVECQPVREMALKVAGMQEAVMESFKREIGKTVTLATRKGADTGEIAGVSGDAIQLKKPIVIDGHAAGFVEEKYRLVDLTVDEWLLRLSENSAEQQLMRGLLTYQNRSIDKAREMFQQTLHPLGRLLDAHLGDLQAAAAQREKAIIETSAQTAYNALLRLAAPDFAGQDPEILPGLIHRTKVSSRLRSKVQSVLQTYWTQHGKSDWAKSHMDVLSALTEIGSKAPKTIKVDENTFDKALDKLKADNSDGQLYCKALLEDGGINLTLQASRNLTNLSALAGLPVKQLSLAGCVRVADISPLEGMPLESLNLDDTLVEDLRPLRGAPLKELWLNRCKNIRSLKPLKDCPLRFLGVAGCAENLDLTPVLTLPGIKIDK